MISKETFLEIMSLLRKQREFDENFSNDMQKYFDGHFASNFNNDLMLAFEKLFNVTIKNSEDWLEWYLYECHMGDRPMEVYINGEEFRIASDEDFYNLLIKF